MVDDSPNGGLTQSTKAGIAVGVGKSLSKRPDRLLKLCIVLFCTLLVAFYFVAKHHKKRCPPTPAEMANARTFERWSENLAGKGKSTRTSHSNSHRYGNHAPEYHLPSNTLYAASISEYTVVEADERVEPTPAPLPVADIPHCPAEVQGVDDTRGKS